MARFITAIFTISIAATAAGIGARELTEIRNFDLPTIEKLGRDMYERDILAAAATDILFKNSISFTENRLRGWVVSRESGHDIVTFVAESFSQPRAVFEIRPNEVPARQIRKLDNTELAPDLITQYNARQLALQNIDEPCSDRYNPVVLKEPNSQNYLVYALAATTKPNIVPVGGHYRFTIDPSGRRILQKDKLSRSCLVFSKTPGDLPPGATLSGYAMSHIVSNTPVETHVFLNLLHRIELSVGTIDGVVWQVSGGKISKNDKSADPARPNENIP